MENFIYPDNASSLVNIPHSILAHFDLPHEKSSLKQFSIKRISQCSKIILFLADGLGYNLWKRQTKINTFFKKISQEGLVSKLTTIFPSTTAAAITTLNSGLTPKEHGLLEWNLYFREFDCILETLPYRVVPNKHQQMKILPGKPKILFSETTIYQKLKQANIPSFYFIPKELTDNVYIKAIAKGSTIIPYISITDLMVVLRHKLSTHNGKSYYFVYWPEIDSLEHFYGPASKEVNAGLSLLSYMLENELIGKLGEKTASDTVMILTSDHGLCPTHPENTIYLNQYPQITNYFKRSSFGKPILPTGSPRDVFLNIQEERINEVVAFLRNTFGDVATVIRVDKEEDMLTRLFGKSKQHKEFSSRLGNILVLPKNQNTIWYEYLPGEKFVFRGHHGGLSSDEMFIPLITITARLS